MLLQQSMGYLVLQLVDFTSLENNVTVRKVIKTFQEECTVVVSVVGGIVVELDSVSCCQGLVEEPRIWKDTLTALPEMLKPLVLVGATLTVCCAIIVHDPPEQLYDWYYAGPEFGFIPVARVRPVYSVARAILPGREHEPDTYDLHGLYHP
ncbi:uncharacterized protein LOC129003690 [Macrosteles quadrilineatus]|uniref:uncharacterized protein LOC129003690 n=1 Tax=Macrosteles quadrilineatus TaxID=74068 RepID=UPI0023E0AA29|nr:uncharacterized protein LOC129003690 [Macrosteles quadrilineatus]